MTSQGTEPGRRFVRAADPAWEDRHPGRRTVPLTGDVAKLSVSTRVSKSARATVNFRLSLEPVKEGAEPAMVVRFPVVMN